MTMDSTHVPSVNEVAEEARAQMEELRGKMNEVSKRTLDFIRERPGTSLLVALGAGYLIGRILR